MGTTHNTYDQATAKIDYTNRQLTGLLNSSIAKEENGKKMANKIVTLEEERKTLRLLIEPLVQQFECTFSQDSNMSVEYAQEYVNAAKYLRDTFNRKGDIITHVQMWIDSPDSLPFK